MSTVLTAPTTPTAAAEHEDFSGIRVEILQPLLTCAALAILCGAMVIASVLTGSEIVLAAAALPLIGASFLAVFASFRSCF